MNHYKNITGLQDDGSLIAFFTLLAGSCLKSNSVQFNHSVVSDSLRLAWTAAHQASLCITNSQSLLKLMSVESVIPSNHLIFCRPLVLPPSIFPSIRLFSNESALCIRWPKYWSFNFNISPSNEYLGLISFRIDIEYLQAKNGFFNVFNMVERCLKSNIL